MRLECPGLQARGKQRRKECHGFGDWNAEAEWSLSSRPKRTSSWFNSGQVLDIKKFMAPGGTENRIVSLTTLSQPPKTSTPPLILRSWSHPSLSPPNNVWGLVSGDPTKCWGARGLGWKQEFNQRLAPDAEPLPAQSQFGLQKCCWHLPYNFQAGHQRTQLLQKSTSLCGDPEWMTSGFSTSTATR